MNKKDEIIELKNVSQIFETSNDSLQVIKNIELSIFQKEFICVVGPSGCGKSTLLKLIAGFLTPTMGECKMHGKQILKPNKSRGVVFQSATLYPWLTVAENVAYGLKISKVSKDKIEKLVNQYLKDVDLLKFKDRYPFELSGGMKQRVAICRTLINQPELILMDEPFSALDAITRNSMQRLLREIWKEKNQTIFMITHDIEEALKLATRVLVMSKNPGEVIYELSINYTNKINSEENYFPDKDIDFQKDKICLFELIS